MRIKSSFIDKIFVVGILQRGVVYNEDWRVGFFDDLQNDLFKRNKEEYYIISQKEHIIDCKYTQGKAEVPLINKRELNREVQKIKSREQIRYVHVGGIEILIKA